MFSFLLLKICFTTANLQHPLACDFLYISTPDRPTMDKSKCLKKTERLMLHGQTYLLSLLMTHMWWDNNKKSNVARHFHNKHTAFAQKYQDGDERKKAVSELMWKVDVSKNHFKKLMKSANLLTFASFVATQEIVRHGKPFTDGE